MTTQNICLQATSEMRHAKITPSSAHKERLFLTLLLMLLTTASAWALTFWSGSGTSDSPYLITSASDLAQLATDVNGGTNYDDVYFKQTADITLTSNWTPIGTATNPFKGHYDGGGYAITGLQVTGSYQYAGLFGVIASGEYVPQKGYLRQAVLKDINIVECNINVGSSGNAGGIAGQASTIDMSGCRVSGTITGNGKAGGLIGYIDQTSGVKVTDCFVDVSVTSPSQYYPEVRLMAYVSGGSPTTSGNYCHDRIGSVSTGITATSLYTVTGAPSGVTVAAGNATVTYNETPYFAAGATTTLTVDDAHKAFNDNFGVSGTGSSYTLAGNKRSATVTIGSGDVTVSATLLSLTGSCGDNATWSISDTNSDGTYETLTISGTGAITSSPWAADFAAGIERVNISSADLTINDNPFSTLGNDAVIVVPTPAYAISYSSAAFASKLRVALGSYLFTATNEGGTAAYEIANETDLRNLAAVINGNIDASTAITGSGMTFRQTADIAFSDQTFAPIGAQGTSGKWFSGTYDGGNHTISGLKVSTGDRYAGLFGRVFGATIKNVVLVSPTVTSNYNSSIQYAQVGALVGRTEDGSSVENCLVISPTVSASNGKKYVGAIVGYLYATYDKLINSLFYSTTDYAYAGSYEAGSIINSGRGRKVTLGEGVTIESPVGLVYNADTYYCEGAMLTLTNNAPTGYVTDYRANGTAIGGNTYTVNNGDVTLTLGDGNVPITYTITYNLNGGTLSTDKNSYTIESSDITLDEPSRTGYTFLGWYDNEDLTGNPVTTIAHGSTGDVKLWAKWVIPYIDADGNTLYRNSATVLTNGTNVDRLSAGWYVVTEDVSYSSQFFCNNGDIHLILCDGAKMTVTNSDDAIYLNNSSLTIYAQSTGSSMGQLVASSTSDGIYAGNVTICGGRITATGYNRGIYGRYYVTIHGGQVSATGDKGILSGTIILGLRNATDYITASSYKVGSEGNISVKDGQTLYDELGNAYNGTLTDEQKNALASKTLKPSLYISGTGDDWNHAYMIYNKDQLDLLAQRVNNGNNYSGKYFKLGANITYTHKADDEPGADTENNYTAIGNNNRPFRGHFDGNGFTISGIRICQGGSDYQGLFGYIDGSTTEVKNVVLADARITGKSYTGGIVGNNNGGTVTNCHALSTVTIHAVQDNAWNHGGIVGGNYNNGTVSGCTSAASITTVTGIFPNIYNNSQYGGIVGDNMGTVKDCLYLGNTLEGYHSVGAIVGYNDSSATVQNCYFTSTAIRGKNDNGKPLANAASAVGEKYGTITTTGLARTVTADESVTIESVTFTGDATQYGTDGITAYSGGGLAYGGKLYYGSECVLSLTLSELPTGEAPAGCHYGYYVNAGTLAAAGDNYTLTMPDANVTLSALTPIDWATVSDGSSSNPYIIYNKGQLDLLAKRVNSGTGDDYAASGYDGRYFKLGADITYTHKATNEEGADTEDNYTAIGGNGHVFFGHFDGQNHTVSGIRIYKGDSDYQGLFGWTGSDVTVANVILADARITGGIYTGGIVGFCSYRTVSNCHVLGDVTIHAVDVENSSYHGGIVGYVASNCTVTGCTSAANITAAANVSCGLYGGIVGKNNGTVSDCLYLGNTVEGTISVGAIAGRNGSDKTISNCYFTSTAISGKDDSSNPIANADSAVGSNENGGNKVTNCGLAPSDNVDNSNFLTLMAARNAALTAVDRTTPLSTDVDITLNGRTLYKDGAWNTLCLPFNATLTGDLANATLMELDTDAGSYEHVTGLDNGTLYLNFKDATSIKAGKPYIIKWANGSDITNPVFTGVTINNSASREVSFEGGKFVGTYKPIVWNTENKSILFLGDNNTLYWPKPEGDNMPHLNACRAYFELSDPNGVREFNLNFDGEETTSITTTDFTNLTNSDEWYDMQGRKVSGKPTKKGMYIHNGNKVVIK